MLFRSNMYLHRTREGFGWMVLHRKMLSDSPASLGLHSTIMEDLILQPTMHTDRQLYGHRSSCITMKVIQLPVHCVWHCNIDYYITACYMLTISLVGIRSDMTCTSAHDFFLRLASLGGGPQAHVL